MTVCYSVVGNKINHYNFSVPLKERLPNHFLPKYKLALLLVLYVFFASCD